jgi:hypothetical protein
MLLAACQVPHAGTLGRSNPTAPAKPIAAIAQKNVAPAMASPQPVIAIAAATQNDSAAIGPALRLTGEPKELIGLDHATVRRALGDPLRIRKEQPAQVWQYATGDCVVDLYFYMLDGALKVTFVEARSHSAEAEPTGRCLKSLLERPTAQAD